MDKHALHKQECTESILEVVKSISNGLLDLVYPPKCLVCGEMQPKYLCETCISEINNIEPPVCNKCGVPKAESRCTECADVEFTFDSARSVGEYEGVLKEAIHRLKYSGHRVMAPALGALLVELIHRQHANHLRKNDCIIPVPIHKSKMRMRGFNQSELLAKEVAVSFGIPLETRALARIHATRAQVNLPLNERHENVQGAFRVIDENLVRDKRILLVDDVFTTGSTLDSAARVLREAGSREINVLTVARSL